mmetsp:Transcript_15659/g.17390  ORF Transcript_15659/g.17390 Transcript_15659/m.17390 type:complete len:323 (+) Transcript_15659:19-987(+)|eukprot:CAMPEP_0205823400 /NCGR_PEP_ID=MMETSP0206-20130828/16357_1 /ASSEMBLY_ACC=CAM_ASM_000279 /TAXON_ID=36767 /ORGANISM="Euplotes focardii, Strain TN1" /LENGTH=322 /DNA_ID=CAMNT_0053120523 /DNA_START=16 /DNA_END=984 /DNA_ORIENTATION=+
MLGFIFSSVYFFLWLGAWLFGLLSAGQIIFALAKLINRELIRVPFNLTERYGKNTWAIVTGASGGLGSEFSKQLAKAGFNIVLISRRQGELDKVETEIKTSYPNVQTKTIAADFAANSTPEFYKDIEKQLSSLEVSVLVNNAGLLSWGKFENQEPQQLQDMVNVNSTSYAMLTHVFINRLLKRNPRSAIVNVGSLASYAPTPFQGCYSATKRLVRFFTYGLNDNYKHKIDFLCLSPGFVETKMIDNTNPDMVATPDVTVKNALRDLGHELETTGYWLHTIQGFMIENMYRYTYPVFKSVIKGAMEVIALRVFKADTLKKKEL